MSMQCNEFQGNRTTCHNINSYCLELQKTESISLQHPQCLKDRGGCLQQVCVHGIMEDDKLASIYVHLHMQLLLASPVSYKHDAYYNVIELLFGKSS